MGRTYVCKDWEPRNEYTTPIQEEPAYRNSGIIKVLTSDGDKVQVGRITYEAFENEEFQYIITPFWEIIDTLSSDVFQGIPGIDMELRLEHYYRVNYVPVFMTERTPGPNREDLWELLDSVNLNYYDRLEWLIRTDLRAAVDNLIVERARDTVRNAYAADWKELERLITDGQYGDQITVANLQILGHNSKECTKMLNRLMHYGIRLVSHEEHLDMKPEDYKVFMPVIEMMYELDKKERKQKQIDGIEKAKNKGVYQGRKRKQVDENLFKEAVQRFRGHEISLQETLELTGLSKATFYRRVKEL